jgi:branched-chain amino acid transport system permease protein
MEVFISYLISGMQLGILYGIVTIGYNLLVLVTNVLQFSYAHLLVFSMYIAWVVFGITGDNLVLGITAAICSAIIVNTLTTFLLLPFIKKRFYLESLVLCITIGMIVVEILSHWFNLGLAIVFPATLQMSDAVIKSGMISVNISRLISLFMGLILVYLFFKYLYSTKRGMILRAVAQNSEVATYLGISITKMSIFSFALSGLLAGVVAILLAMSVGSASPEMGDNVALMCLAIILLGGVGNLKGGFICAIILGAITGLVMGYLPGDWTMAIAFAVILGVLLFRPQGIFGEAH